jgi:hypothetical protein
VRAPRRCIPSQSRSGASPTTRSWPSSPSLRLSEASFLQMPHCSRQISI